MNPNKLMRLAVGASVILVVAALGLYWLAKSTGAEQSRAAIDHIQKIDQLAAEWSIETARVRSDPMADFDGLAAFIPRMDALQDGLLANVRGNPNVADRLANDVSAYISAVEAKEERIERFKTGYAVIRNSSRYLPLAASGVVQAPNVDAQLATEVASLTNEINTYLVAPTDAGRGRLTVALERLASTAANLEAPLSGHIINYISHAEVLLEQQAPNSELFAQATSSEISDFSAQLLNEFAARLGSQEQSIRNYASGIFAAGALLVLIWILVATTRMRAVSTAAPAIAAAFRRVAPPARTAGVTAAAGRHGGAMAKRLLAQQIVANHIAGRLLDAADGITAQLTESPAIEHAALANGHAARIALVNTPDARGPDKLPPQPGGRVADGGSAAGGETRANGEALARVADITRLADRLADFSTLENGADFSLVSLNDCIDEAVEAVDAKASVEVVTNPGNSPEVFASRMEICLMLEKVLENSVRAVVDAGREHGEIKIATGADDGRATITIIDNGIGMTPAEREQMFEPFHGGGEGGRMGVGLLSTTTLVEKYNGTIAVNSVPGSGTVIRIMLPAMPDEQHSSAAYS